MNALRSLLGVPKPHILCLGAAAAFLVCFLGAQSWAQVTPDAPGAGEEDGTDSSSAGASDDRAAASDLKGDVIVLVTGKEFRNFQIIHETPSKVTVEIIPGVLTMDIPRSEIESIVYDDVVPGAKTVDVQVQQQEEVEAPPLVFPGQELPEEMAKKMSVDIGTPPLQFENEDILMILPQLFKRIDVLLSPDEHVRNLPKENRLCSVTVKSPATLHTVLQQILRQLPGIDVVFQSDRVVVTTKENAAGLRGDLATEDPPVP